MTNRSRKDKGQTRKVTPEELLEAINAAKPHFHNHSANKRALYRCCIEKGLLQADRIAQTTFYRFIREYDLLPVTIAALGRDGPPSKMSEGHFRFLCPRCGEMLATVNPRNNLAHCFNCKTNLNSIDLLIRLGHDFREPAILPPLADLSRLSRNPPVC